MFYAPQIFESIGGGTGGALESTVVTGAVNVVSTIVAILAVDRLGRRVLFLQAGVQMFVSEVIVGALMYLQFAGSSSSLSVPILIFICTYVAGFAWSWGPLAWLIPSEIAPLEIRAASTAINT